MMPDMAKNSLVIDDVNHWETEKLIEFYKPDIFCAGIKEKYVVQKLGVPLKQLHSYDYGGPYAAFGGAVNFYRKWNVCWLQHLEKGRCSWETEPKL
jgi:nitrogenase molybdenum-iron protein alpha chain